MFVHEQFTHAVNYLFANYVFAKPESQSHAAGICITTTILLVVVYLIADWIHKQLRNVRCCPKEVNELYIESTAELPIMEERQLQFEDELKASTSERPLTLTHRNHVLFQHLLLDDLITKCGRKVRNDVNELSVTNYLEMRIREMKPKIRNWKRLNRAALIVKELYFTHLPVDTFLDDLRHTDAETQRKQEDGFARTSLLSQLLRPLGLGWIHDTRPVRRCDGYEIKRPISLF
jgi:hypothetical protein